MSYIFSNCTIKIGPKTSKKYFQLYGLIAMHKMSDYLFYHSSVCFFENVQGAVLKCEEGKESLILSLRKNYMNLSFSFKGNTHIQSWLCLF